MGNLIVKSKIKKVIFSIIDIDKRTKGKSIKIRDYQVEAVQ